MIQTTCYIIAGVAILFLIVGLLHIKENDVFSKITLIRFKVLACFIIIEIGIDTIFIALSGTNVSKELLYILKSIELSMNLVLPILTVELFNSYSKEKNPFKEIIDLFKGKPIKKISDLFKRRSKRTSIKRIKFIIFILMIINFVFQITTIFANVLFYIDEQNIYHRTNITIIYAISIAVCVGLIVSAANIFSYNLQNLNKLTLIGFCVIFTVGFVLRLIVQDMNFDWLCISMSYFIITVYYYNASFKIDSLTQLLNRHVYDNLSKERINFTTVIVMIDANNFKEINDTHGHASGDKTLKVIADCILKAFREIAYCFRLGGDEFCIILKPGIYDTLVEETPYHDEYAMANNLTKRLNAIIQQTKDENDSDNVFLEHGVSQGWGIYYEPSENRRISKKSKKTFEQVQEMADKRMYKQKKEFKGSVAKTKMQYKKNYSKNKKRKRWHNNNNLLK